MLLGKFLKNVASKTLEALRTPAMRVLPKKKNAKPLNAAQKLLQSFYEGPVFRIARPAQTKQQMLDEHTSRMKRAAEKRERRGRFPNATDRAWLPRRMEGALT